MTSCFVEQTKELSVYASLSAFASCRVWNRGDLRTKLIVLGPPLGRPAESRDQVQLSSDALFKRSALQYVALRI